MKTVTIPVLIDTLALLCASRTLSMAIIPSHRDVYVAIDKVPMQRLIGFYSILSVLALPTLSLAS